METELLQKIDALEKKTDAIYKSVERARKYFLWTLIVSVAMIILPLIGLAFAIPFYLRTISPASLGL